MGWVALISSPKKLGAFYNPLQIYVLQLRFFKVDISASAQLISTAAVSTSDFGRSWQRVSPQVVAIVRKVSSPIENETTHTHTYIYIYNLYIDILTS